MRVTISIDDALYEQALEMAGPNIAKTEIFREAVQTFVRVQAAKRLAALGDAMPGMPDIPRRRSRARALCPVCGCCKPAGRPRCLK